MKSSFCHVSIVFLMAFVFGVMTSGCKDDSATTPSGPTASYGSGTITATSSAGSLSITGTGVWPMQAVPSVLAVYDTSIGALVVYAYQLVSGTNYNGIALLAYMATKVDTGTHYPPWRSMVAVTYNVVLPVRSDTLAYGAVSGSIIVSSVNGSNVIGTYSVMARKGTAQPIQITGTFNAMFVVGRMPEYQPGRSVTGFPSLPPLSRLTNTDRRFRHELRNTDSSSREE